MTKDLPSTLKKVKAAWRITKAIGPIIISQSKKASEAYVKHQKKLVDIGAYKELITGEVHAVNKIRLKLLNKFYEAPAEERFKIKKDIQAHEKEINRLNIYLQAVNYIPEDDTTDDGNTNTTEPISSSWIDRFNEFAERQNEDWRQDLLSRALANEAQNSGSVGTRALWFIGTIDDTIFHAFASLINISITFGDTHHAIPRYDSFTDKTMPDCALGPNIQLSSIIFKLGELGLMGDISKSFVFLSENTRTFVTYGTKKHCLTMIKDYKVYGIVLTELGETIASLYSQRCNQLGIDIFNSWIESIRSEVGISTILISN